MTLPKYLQKLIDAGEATVGISDSDKGGSFIGHPFEIERRGIAKSKLEAAALGKPVFIDDKGRRVTVRTVPVNDGSGLSVVLKGKNIDQWGKANLARNSGNELRRANARFVEQPGMDLIEDKSGMLYGAISQGKRDDAHHISGINSSARYKQSLEERRRDAFQTLANAHGIYFGDHPRNLSSIPGERAVNRPNLHQSAIHTAEDPRSVSALLARFGLPNAANPKVDLVGPVQAAREYNTQKEAAALAGLAIERLSVQLAMLDTTSPGARKTIEQSIGLIDRALRNTEEMGPIGERPNKTNARALREMLAPILSESGPGDLNVTIN